MVNFSRLKAAGRDYLLHDERGNATVETVLWIPIYVLFFSLIVDASMMFNGQAHLTRLAQDASRQFAIGRLATPEETKQYILARMGKSASAPRTEVIVDPGASDGIIRTQITVDAGYFMAVGFFDALDHIQLVVRSEHMREI